MQGEDKAFLTPNNPERSERKKKRNISDFAKLKLDILERSRESTLAAMSPTSKPGEAEQLYDDELVSDISGEFSDRISVFPLIGDIVRALGGLLRGRGEVDSDLLARVTVDTITTDKYINRADVAKLTKISPVTGNSLVPFMNGGPAGENWDTAGNGFYDWINRSRESIIGIELGFKADDYGQEVSNRLIKKKKADPNVSITLLIDGFVSIIMQKPSSDFEQNTVEMIMDMRQAGIDVRVNDSPNPLSSDFFAANHMKLWIFDGQTAFFGGIGIETQFRKILYDEMDLVQGPFVKTLNMIALLLLANQRGPIISPGKTEEINELPKEKILALFAKSLPKTGNITLKVSTNVPGYVQDARREYVDLLTRDDLEEVYIMAPYFSDEKIARGLIRAARRLQGRLAKEKERQLRLQSIGQSKAELQQLVIKELQNDKRIHIVFPTKQENKVIEDISKYYAYHLRNNPIVETRQFFVKADSETYEMLHAKQMVVVLRDRTRNWTKYVKFGGSYNPAGKAQHMWELNATAYNGSWEESDEGPSASSENQIKNYLEGVMKVVVGKYSIPFPWGQANVKLSMGERLVMNLAEAFWFLT